MHHIDQSVNEILQDLQSMDAFRRKCAASDLGDLPWSDEVIVGLLEKATYTDPDETVAEAARKALEAPIHQEMLKLLGRDLKKPSFQSAPVNPATRPQKSKASIQAPVSTPVRTPVQAPGQALADPVDLPTVAKKASPVAQTAVAQEEPETAAHQPMPAVQLVPASTALSQQPMPAAPSVTAQAAERVSAAAKPTPSSQGVPPPIPMPVPVAQKPSPPPYAPTNQPLKSGLAVQAVPAPVQSLAPIAPKPMAMSQAVPPQIPLSVPVAQKAMPTSQADMQQAQNPGSLRLKSNLAGPAAGTAQAQKPGMATQIAPPATPMAASIRSGELPIDSYTVVESKGLKKKTIWTANFSATQAEFISQETNRRIVVARGMARSQIRFGNAGLYGGEGTVAAVSGVSLNFGANKARLEKWLPPRTTQELGKELRGWGIGLIIVGVASILLHNILNPVWGGIIIVLGIVNLLVKHRAMFIINGISLIIVGGWNILSIIAALSSGGFTGWVVFGGMQILWGIQEIGKYGKYAPGRK